MLSPDVRTSFEDDVIADPSKMDEPASDTLQEAPSLEDVIQLMVDDSGKPPGCYGCPTVLPEPTPEVVLAMAVTGQG